MRKRGKRDPSLALFGVALFWIWPGKGRHKSAQGVAFLITHIFTKWLMGQSGCKSICMGD
jgi:hypothetical protein